MSPARKKTTRSASGKGKRPDPPASSPPAPQKESAWNSFVAAFPDRFSLAAAILVPGYVCFVSFPGFSSTYPGARFPASELLEFGALLFACSALGLLLDTLRWLIFDLPAGLGGKQPEFDDEARRHRSPRYRPYQILGNLTITLPPAYVALLIWHPEGHWGHVYTILMVILLEVALLARTSLALRRLSESDAKAAAAGTAGSA